jgi:ABC-type phosphate transport system substrate-binding protein
MRHEEKMIAMKKLLLMALAVSVLALLAPRAAAQSIVIVANKSNAVDSVTTAQLKKILLGEQTTWTGGKQVIVLLRNPGSPERDIPLQVICGMSETEFKQYFSKASFNGSSATPPRSMGTAALLRQLITTLPGAIGFLDASEVNDSVKVIKLDGEAPASEGYKLKK